MTIVRWIWRILMGIKNLLVLLFLLLFFGLLYAVLSSTPTPAIPSEGALVLDLDGTIVEQPSGTSPAALLNGDAGRLSHEIRLRDVVHALTTAATDKRVKAVALDLDGFLGAQPAALSEITTALDRVRQQGKPVIAFATAYSDDSYRLAAHATEAWLDPLGAVVITGPGGQQLYYRGLMDKLGIEARVYRVGTYKAAVEPYTRNDPSPEARAAAQALANGLWQDWQNDVREGRPKARATTYVAEMAAALRARGGDLASLAQRYALVDHIGDRTAWNQRMIALVGATNSGHADQSQPPFKAIPLDNWVAAHKESHDHGDIGVVTVSGPIIDGEAGPGSAAGDTIAALIREAIAKGRIKALVVRIDSPGGSVLASEQIRRALAEAKARNIPVIASMGGVAASGGYWVATAADQIIADPGTITGSIGVFGIFPTFEGAMNKLGLHADGVKTTPFSGEPDLYHGPSNDMSTIIQSGVEDIYRRFIGLVAKSRHMTPARVDQIAQGRVWSGSNARQLGLVDHFGTLDDAILAAAKAAKLDPASAKLNFLEPQRSWLDELASAGFADVRQVQAGPRAGSADIWTRIAGRPSLLLARAAYDARFIINGPAMQVRCLECDMAVTPASPWTRDRSADGLAALLFRTL